MAVEICLYLCRGREVRRQLQQSQCFLWWGNRSRQYSQKQRSYSGRGEQTDFGLQCLHLHKIRERDSELVDRVSDLQLCDHDLDEINQLQYLKLNVQLLIRWWFVGNIECPTANSLIICFKYRKLPISKFCHLLQCGIYVENLLELSGRIGSHLV